MRTEQELSALRVSLGRDAEEVDGLCAKLPALYFASAEAHMHYQSLPDDCDDTEAHNRMLDADNAVTDVLNRVRILSARSALGDKIDETPMMWRLLP